MTETQNATLQTLKDNAGTGWVAAWTLTNAASCAAARSGDALPFVDAVPLLLASADLRAAEDYLEQARRGLPTRCAAVDIGSSVVALDGPSACRGVERVLCATLESVRHLRSSEPAGVGAVELARVDTLLSSARRLLLGSQR
ncbi:hypothetical protein [Cellulomonas cellasea]|uniref:Uncharacterized protein n=1 Tax=Cellulomonas cellasea TaxID=43670 RepID=A0A7W4YA16_9CELL|nr:hypothetical protein [Cellulomonas cellasea]MBB2921277.1 hypothetical protein [Cellulomonas cellasea]